MRRMSVLLRIHECYGIRRTRGGTAILPFRRRAFEEHRAFSNGATEQFRSSVFFVNGASGEKKGGRFELIRFEPSFWIVQIL